MRSGNLLALVLFLVGLSFFTVGMGMALLGGNMQTLSTVVESSKTMTPYERQVMEHGLETYGQSTFVFMSSMIAAVPGVGAWILALGAWFFVGRRQDELLRRQIALRAAREGGPGEPPPLKVRPWLVRGTVALFLAFSTLVFGWTLLTIVALETSQAAREQFESKGIRYDTAVKTTMELMGAAIALVPLVAAGSLWWLYRRDRKLLERWRRLSTSASSTTPPRLSSSQAS